MKQDPTDHFQLLLSSFNIVALGEGDPVAGLNTLVAWACSLANVSYPGSGLITKDERILEVGCNLWISGSLTNALIHETVVNPLAHFQSSLNSHTRRYLELDAFEKQKPFGSQKQHRSFPSMNGAERLFQSLQESEPLLVHTTQEALQQVLEEPASLTEEEKRLRSQVLFQGSNVAGIKQSLHTAHLGKPLILYTLTSSEKFARAQEFFSNVIHGFSSGEALPRHYKGMLHLFDQTNAAHLFFNRHPDSFIQLVWLHDGGHGPQLPQLSQSSQKIPHQALRTSLNRALSRRTDAYTTLPHYINSEFLSFQSHWVKFLRRKEADLPGISNVAKNLFATLLYAFRDLLQDHPQALDLSTLYNGTLSLAKYVVERSATERMSLVCTGQRERENSLKVRILNKLEGQQLKTRDIYRNLSIPACECERLLLELESEEKIIKSNAGWLKRNPQNLEKLLPKECT